jgi:mRNA interferase MazF
MSFKKWDIYRANLDPIIGSEQGKSRPVLIISEDYINELLNVVNVLPITTRKIGRQIYPNEALVEANLFGLEKESIVLCHQIRTLDKSRLSNKFGSISTIDKQNEVIESLCFQLGIDKTN